jgi:hypothetical protein
MEDRFESLARIRAITEPLLVMHGDRDYTIPQRFGRRLFEAANQPKQGFWPQGLGHSDIFDNGGFDTALEFIRRTLKLPGDAIAGASNGRRVRQRALRARRSSSTQSYGRKSSVGCQRNVT